MVNSILSQISDVIIIFSSLIIATFMLFTTGSREFIDVARSPFSVRSDRTIGGLALVLIILGSISRYLFNELLGDRTEQVAEALFIIQIFWIFILIFIYTVFFIKVRKRRAEILQLKLYKKNKKIYARCFYSWVAILFVSGFMSSGFIFEVMTITDKSLIFTFIYAPISCFFVSIFAAGYLHSYGSIYNLETYKITFKEMINKTFGAIDIENEITAIIVSENNDFLKLKLNDGNIIDINAEQVFSYELINEKDDKMTEKRKNSSTIIIWSLVAILTAAMVVCIYLANKAGQWPYEFWISFLLGIITGVITGLLITIIFNDRDKKREEEERIKEQDKIKREKERDIRFAFDNAIHKSLEDVEQLRILIDSYINLHKRFEGKDIEIEKFNYLKDIRLAHNNINYTIKNFKNFQIDDETINKTFTEYYESITKIMKTLNVNLRPSEDINNIGKDFTDEDLNRLSLESAEKVYVSFNDFNRHILGLMTTIIRNKEYRVIYKESNE